MSTVSIQGLDECMRNLRTLPDNVQKNILRGAVYNTSNYVRDRMKEAAPVLKPGTINPHDRRIGELRDNIVAVMAHAPRGKSIGGMKIRNSKKDIREAVKKLSKKKNITETDVLRASESPRYWTAVEYGHTSKARPFIRATWDRISNNTLAYMRDYIISRIINLRSEWI